MLRRILAKFLPSRYPGAENAHTLNVIYGHLRSVKSARPVDAEGVPLPWFTYPAIEYLEELDLAELSVFEYGSGYGTLYWAGRVGEVYAVEDDPVWHEELKLRLPENVRLRLATSPEDYVGAIAHTGSSGFDIIIIDGTSRERCAKAVSARLNEGGFIILDNSDWYSGAAKCLREQGYIQVDFKGFGPVNAYTWCTSIYFDRKFSPKARHDKWPLAPRGGRNYTRA